MISLDNLVALHDNANTIRRHRRLLEELFYLCINPTFVDTVAGARLELQEMMLETGIIFPINNLETVTALKSQYLLRNDTYQTLLVGIGEKHNFYHPSFVRDYSRVAGEADIRYRLNILENILFLNNPLPDINQDPIEHFNNRSGYMEIAHDEAGPYIRMQFDIGTTLKEIQDIIDKRFPETAQLQEQNFNIPDMQYRVDRSLRIKALIYEQTLLNRNDTQVAITLDDAGLYGTENTGDNVRMQRNRMNKASARFNPND